MTWSLSAPVTLPHLLPLHESYLSLILADPAGRDPLSNLKDQRLLIILGQGKSHLLKEAFTGHPLHCCPQTTMSDIFILTHSLEILLHRFALGAVVSQFILVTRIAHINSRSHLQPSNNGTKKMGKQNINKIYQIFQNLVSLGRGRVTCCFSP